MIEGMPSNQPAEIAALLDRYLVGLDDDKLDDDWARRLFTEDARVEFPMSEHVGLAGLAAYHRDAMANFGMTQHLNSPAVVELDGASATLRANLVSTHVHRPADPAAAGERPPLFTAGTFVTGEACRTPAGWRLRRLSFRLVWATGTPPGSPQSAD
jgi:SnoaL-like domain